MAINATAVWRVRPSGNNANGAGYDASISGAGTDYSQQDAAQLSLTDIACSNTTSVTSATGGFTSAMVGNAMQITGGGATAGFYFMTGYTSTNSVTFDRSPGTVSAGTGKLGGALGGSGVSPFILMDSSRVTGNKAVPGNTIYFLGLGGSPDYSWAGIAANPPVAGDTTNGRIVLSQDPNSTAKPFFKRTDGDIVFGNGSALISFVGLKFSASSAASGRIFDGGSDQLWIDCMFDMNNLGTTAINLGAATEVFNCEFFSLTTATPTGFNINLLLGPGSTDGAWIHGCNFHDLGLIGIGAQDQRVVITSCVFSSSNQTSQKPYVVCSAPNTGEAVTILNNTFDKNAGDAVQITTVNALAGCCMLNNIFSNNGGYGVNVTAGTLASNDRIKDFIDYNNFYNNTSGTLNGISAGAHDLALDPQYASAPSNLTVGSNMYAQSFPRTNIQGNTAQTNYQDLGALQHQATGTIVVPNIHRTIYMTEDHFL